MLGAIEERFGICGLSLSEEKTRLIAFGRKAVERGKQRGEKPGTFNYLGFTHYCDKTRHGAFKVGRKTSSKKFRMKLVAMKEWLKRNRNQAVARWWPTLRTKLAGHYRYYGVSGNYKGIQRYEQKVLWLVFKWMNRRSQKKSYRWERFCQYLQRYPLPKPRIYQNLYTLSRS